MFSTISTLASLLAVLGLLLRAGAQDACQTRSAFKFQPTLADGVSAHVIINNLTFPRGIVFDDADSPNLLVIDAGVGIKSVTQRNGTPCTGYEVKTLITNPNLDHGIEVRGGQLFASTSDVVLLYDYNSTALTANNDTAQTIVKNMANDDHVSRTLLLQPSTGTPTHLIISRGSSGNLDTGAANITSGRSQIRRFALNGTIPSGGYDFVDGEVLGWGMRNGVGIAFSQDESRLWEVENSSDDITYNGLDVHEDNPAEELNLVDLSNPSSIGSYYGYPDCFTVWNMTADNGPANMTVGDQFSIGANASRPDGWCSDTTNVVRPVLTFQAHSAPLDIKFYGAPSESQFAIDRSWNGSAFVSFHGSWDRTRPTGYGIVRIPWGNNTPAAAPDSGQGYSFILQAPDLTVCGTTGCIRPVGLAFDAQGRMFASSDATGEIFVLEDKNAPDANVAVVQSAPTFGLSFAAISIVLALLV